jgi:PKD repeat protein
VSLTATNAFGSDVETKTGYITVTEPSATMVITYDDFEGGMGNYTDGGADMFLYTGYYYAYQGYNAADIQDNSGTASSFYHTTGYNVTGYNTLEVDFYFVAISMETYEDFWVQYYDGSTWRTVAAFARGIDFNNNTWYHVLVTISRVDYNFPTNARLRFVCDASGDADDVYIDAIEWRGLSGTSSFGGAVLQASNGGATIVPEEFSVSQNYPNPFNPITNIDFTLPTSSHVVVSVYNILGQEVARLADGYFEAGDHSVQWDAGQNASGVYLYRIEAGEFTTTKKMILLK